MPGTRDTGGHEPVTVCAAHAEAFREVFTSKLSKSHFFSYSGLLVAVAGLFGLFLWTECFGALGAQAEKTAKLDRIIVKVTTEMEYVKIAQNKFSTEQGKMREDMKEEFRRLREMIKHGN